MSDPIRVGILEAAEAALKLQPFNRVSVADIAHAAHVSVGAIYHHFGDKEGLRAAVLQRLMEDFVERHLGPALRSERTPGAGILDVTRAYVRYFEGHPEEFQLLASAQHDERESEHALKFRRITIRHVTSLLTEAVDVARAGQERGELRSAAPGEQILLLWASLYGMCTLMQRYPSPISAAAGQADLEEIGVGLVRTAILASDENAVDRKHVAF